MNRYQKAMEICPVPAELEERLKRRVLAEKPAGGRHRRIIRPRSFARRALLAACGALLTISAGGGGADRVGRDFYGAVWRGGILHRHGRERLSAGGCHQRL